MKELSQEDLIKWLKVWIYKSRFKHPEEKQAHRQIRKLIEGKPKVTRGFVQKWLEEKWCEDWCDPSYYNVLLSWLIDLLIEAGVDIEK